MDKKLISTVVAWLLILGAFAWLTDGLALEPRNLSNLLRQTSINGILAVGMTWVILLGGVDLSVGSVAALVGILIATAQTAWGLSAWGVPGVALTIVLGCLAGLAIGAFNGLWIARLKIHSFVVTFGMMVIARGLAMIVSGGQSISPMGSELNTLGAGYLSHALTGALLAFSGISWATFIIFENRKLKHETGVLGIERVIQRGHAKLLAIMVTVPVIGYICLSYNGLPIPVLLFAFIALLGGWVLAQTRFGRYIYAVGGNPEAARLAGIPVQKVVFSVFTIMGGLAALGGVVLTARLNGATPTAGNLFELDAIAAVVIGGTSLRGGKGHVLGSVVGALLIESLNNGMSLLNVPTFYQMPLKGMVVILAVAMDAVLDDRKST